ncbi:MAG: transcription antitermination factor NusB, partial [Mariprofundaceae bacterium]
RWYSLEADMSRFCRAKPDDWAQLALLLGTYQIRYMRIPDHAAVGETVEAVKAIQPRTAGYVNAVLRQVTAHAAPTKLKPYQKAELPRWMYGQWRDAFGADAVASFAPCLQEAPRLCVAVFGERNDWLAKVQGMGIEAEPGELSPNAVLMPGGTDVTALPGYEAGEFTVMDQAAQAAVMALPDMVEGALILDLCAAPGGKTALLAQRFPGAKLVAVELNERRIPRLLDNMQRLGPENVSVLRADAGRLPFPADSIDAIFLDAPCSASGVLRRHPDAKFLHDAAAVERNAALQLHLARESLRVLKKHAPMVYGVCSIHPAENEAVLEALSASQALQMLDSRRLFPSLKHDGFFYSLLKKPG